MIRDKTTLCFLANEICTSLSSNHCLRFKGTSFLCYHDLIHKHAFLSSIAKDVLECEAASFKHVWSCVFVLVQKENGRNNVSFNFIIFIVYFEVRENNINHDLSFLIFRDEHLVKVLLIDILPLMESVSIYHLKIP